MNHLDYKLLFAEPVLAEMFPCHRTDEFFAAIYGDAAEGAYDIELAFVKAEQKRLHFEFRLNRRPGKCLRCNLTHGLPKVFARHPVINVARVVKQIGQVLSNGVKCAGWRLGDTREVSESLHAIPLVIDLKAD